jgi:arylsulfatase A-like enzyme
MKSTPLIIGLLLSMASALISKPMNVVIILADDLGWADTRLYGHTTFYNTPHIQALAERGMTFTRAYSNSPLCSPTRASLLTGQTPARHGSTRPQHHTKDERLKASVADKAPPGDKALGVASVTRLDTSLPTLGKLMKQAGYHTGHFGKWHLGPPPYSPLEHGFDVDVPHWPGPGPAGSYIAPWKFPNFKPRKPEEHIEDRMADEAISWLSTLKNDKPFFLNYWAFSVHGPWGAKQELIKHYSRSVDKDDSQRCPTYAAMIHSLDDAVGRLIKTLDDTGLSDNTIIIFTSDNGGNMYSTVNGEVPTSNRPLRGGKATIYEGGIRVPCVVIWPGVTQAGSVSDEVIQISDIYPTLRNQLGLKVYPAHTVDGIDITPALKGESLDRQAIFTYFPYSPRVPDWLPESVAVHVGDWKLIRLFHQGDNGNHAYRLYNLKDDIGETQSLADRFPEKVRDLDAMIEAHLSDTKAVVPLPNPEFDPAQYHPEKIGVPNKPGHKSKPKKKK